MHCCSVPWRCDYVCQNTVFPATPPRLHSPAVDEKAPVSFNEYFKQNTSFISPSAVAAPLTQPSPVQHQCSSSQVHSHAGSRWILIIAGCFHSFSLLLVFSAPAGSGLGRNIAERHLVQERRLPEPGGPDFTRAAAQSGPRDAVSKEGQLAVSSCP